MYVVAPFSDARVRGRLINVLRGAFGTLEKAEKSHNLGLSGCLEELTKKSKRVKEAATPVTADHSTDHSTCLPSNGCSKMGVSADKSTQTVGNAEQHVEQLTPGSNVCSKSLIFKLIHHLNNSDLLELTNKLFLMAASFDGLDTNPSDFVTLALTSMKDLQEHNKSNLLYKFAYCLGSKKPGTDEPLFPLKRMPFCMVE